MDVAIFAKAFPFNSLNGSNLPLFRDLPFPRGVDVYETWFPQCAICKESVTLEESKADERGQAVHENCYIWSVELRKPRRHIVRTGVVAQKAIVSWPLPQVHEAKRSEYILIPKQLAKGKLSA